jgi:hypothetical protein
MAPSAKSAAREAVVLALILVAVYLLSQASDAVLIGAFDDDGVYTVLARAIAEGRGYVSLHLAGSPVQVKYPPGFPWLLSLVWRATGSLERLQQAVRWMNPLALAVAAALLWWLGRARWRLRVGPLAVLLLFPLLLAPAIQLFSIPLAEPWFLLGWAAALVVWDLAGSSTGLRRFLLAAATGLVAALTVLVRTQAIALLPALGLALARRREARGIWVITLIAALLPLVLWQSYHHRMIAAGPVSLLPDEGAYAAWVGLGPAGVAGSLAGSLALNLRYYPGVLGAYLASIHMVGVAVAVGLFLAIAVASMHGLWREPFLAGSVGGSFLLLLLWPFGQDRLCLSLLPVAGLLVARAAEPWLARLPAARQRWVTPAAFLLLAPVLLRQLDLHNDSLAALAERRFPRVYTADFFLRLNSIFIGNTARWLEQHAPPGARVMTDRPAGVFLYSGHQTVPAAPSQSRLNASVFGVPGRYLAGAILRDSVSYLVVGYPSPGIRGDVQALRERCPGVLSDARVRPDDPPYLFRLTPDHACLAPFTAAP